MSKKYLHIIFALIFIVSFSTAQAQVVKEKSGGFARITAMGANPYIIDPFNMTSNPAWGAYYDNFVFGDLGATQTAFGNDGSGQFIGANFRVTPKLTIGAMLTKNDFNGALTISDLDPTGLIADASSSFPATIPTMDNNIEIMASFSNGGHKFGFGLAYASASNESNPASSGSTVASASQFGLNLGYLGKMGTKLLLDANLSLIMPSASYDPADGSESSVSQTIIGLSARGFYTLSPKVKLVPTFTFQSHTGSAEVASVSGTSDEDLPSTTIIGLGFGFSYESGDFLFAGGPSFASISTTEASDDFSPELTTSYTLFPTWNLGAEWGMLDWLCARFGYISITGSISTETAASTTEVNETIATLYGPTGAYVGLGFKLGNLSIDGTVNSDVLRQGFNNIGGGGATFAYLSVSVEFE